MFDAPSKSPRFRHAASRLKAILDHSMSLVGSCKATSVSLIAAIAL
jgi:hypothetical protein